MTTTQCVELDRNQIRQRIVNFMIDKGGIQDESGGVHMEECHFTLEEMVDAIVGVPEPERIISMLRSELEHYFQDCAISWPAISRLPKSGFGAKDEPISIQLELTIRGNPITLGNYWSAISSRRDLPPKIDRLLLSKDWGEGFAMRSILPTNLRVESPGSTVLTLKFYMEIDNEQFFARMAGAKTTATRA